MKQRFEIWDFINERLSGGQAVTMLVVAESNGSSPGRAGYKMAVAQNGELCGSIGGGVMEVNLVEQCRAALSKPKPIATEPSAATLIDQTHQKHAPNPSGMICSGRQKVIVRNLFAADIVVVKSIIDAMQRNEPIGFEISNLRFQIIENTIDNFLTYFLKTSEQEFVYQEKLGSANEIIIIGGGHCALALSELMSRLDFRVRIFDDRPELNTLEKNEFADEVTIIDSYENIGSYLGSSSNAYVAVMTLGYMSDSVVIKQAIDHEFKYFGVLGSKAKMATLMKELRNEGLSDERLSRIRTPIGLPINSQSPEEIAVSIAAEIIAVKNMSEPPA
ncbi:MAG: XdhC family protein [Pyrinomonadaceae bacterium]